MIIRENAKYDARYKKILVNNKRRKMKKEAERKTGLLEAKIKKGIDKKDLETFLEVLQQVSKNLD